MICHENVLNFHLVNDKTSENKYHRHKDDNYNDIYN